jgi:hypothetical protein
LADSYIERRNIANASVFAAQFVAPEAAAQKLNTLPFRAQRGIALVLSAHALIEERFLAALGMTRGYTFSNCYW